MSPVRANSEVNTPISPSSSGSHLSPVTPKVANEIPSRSPDDPRQTNMTRHSNDTPQQQQSIENVITSINNSLVVDSSPRPNNTTNAESFRESCSPTRPQTSDAQQTQSEQNQTIQSTPNISTNNSNSNGNTASPSNGVLINNIAPSITPPVVVVPRSWVAETNRDNGINNAVRPTDVHGQRTRRSSRSTEEPSRRRSSRSSRQSTSNAPAVNLVRNGANYARPSLDLPPGYGKTDYYMYLYIFDFNSFDEFSKINFFFQKCVQHNKVKYISIIYRLVFQHGMIHAYHEIVIYKILL